MPEICYRLDNFEGPLDLLLHLVSKNKLDLREIKIARICDQYVGYIEEMKELDLDVAGDFLEMASRLLYLKSKILLPKSKDESEDEEVLDLVRMLEEYKKIKEAALELRPLFEIHSKSLVKGPEDLCLPVKYELSEQPDKLIAAYRGLLKRSPKGSLVRFESFKGIVGREAYPVSEKIKEILGRIKNRSRIVFRSLFGGAKNRSEIVAVFLAVLELMKSNRVRVEEGPSGGILLENESEKM